jgi:hypothetical protein
MSIPSKFGENISHDINYPGQDSNRGPAKCETGLTVIQAPLNFNIMTYKKIPHWFVASGVHSYCRMLIQSDPANWLVLNVNFQTHKILADNAYTDVASFTE